MKDYKNRPLSYSSLIRLLTGPQYFLNPGVKESSGFGIGSAVDIYLTEGEDEFNKQIYVNEIEKPTGQLLTLADEVYKHYCVSNEVCSILDYADNELVVGIMDELKLYSNIKDIVKRISKFETNDFWNYLKSLQDAEGKTSISLEDYTKVKLIINSFTTNEFTKKYFVKTNDEVEVLNQYEIKWKFLDQDIISKLDKVLINHKDKTIQPIDIKTLSDPTSMFGKSYSKWKYYYQGSLYAGAISSQILNGDLPAYELLPFKFIVETTNIDNIGQPMIYEMSEKELNSAMLGGKIYDRPVKGWAELIDEKIWYDNNGYDNHKDYIETKGFQTLSLYD